MAHHIESPSSLPSDTPQVVLRGPAELAEALPYFLGFYPDDSIVLIALHGPRGRFGGRLRVGIPARSEEWPDVAAQVADCLVDTAGPAGRPDGIAVFLCREPVAGQSPVQAMERLRPLAQHLRRACGVLDVPVLEALCVCAGRWWSYVCSDIACCPAEGTPLNRAETSVMAAAAAYAGIPVRGSLREMQRRYDPVGGPQADMQEQALDVACATLLPRILDGGADAEAVREETLALAETALERFRAAAPEEATAAGDAHDDALLEPTEAAALILGLQDRTARDRAAEWMEETDAMPALRLWRALARRCVGAYADHSVAPLALAGWICWSSGNEPAARVAFARALDIDPDYVFARLLQQACTHGLDPEQLRDCLREERRSRQVRSGATKNRSRGAGIGTGPRKRPARNSRPASRTSPGRRRRTARSDGDEPGC